MIRQVKGTVLSVDPLGAVIEVAGFGIYVNMSAPEVLTVGMEERLRARVFCLGVGPKTALAILRKAPRESLIGAIGKRDLDYLTRVAGLGKKAAEKLLVELSERVSGSGTHDDGDAEVFDTLVALGYTEKEARACVARIPKAITGKDARLKAALSGATS